MGPFVMLIVVIVVLLLLAKAYRDAQAQREGSEPRGSSPPPPPKAPRRPPRERKEPPAEPKLDEEQLAEHVAKLQKAVDSGLVTMDEAVDSVVRQTGGQLSEEAAKQLIEKRDAA